MFQLPNKHLAAKYHFSWIGDGAGGLKVMFISKITIFFVYDIYNIVKFLMSILNVGR